MIHCMHGGALSRSYDLDFRGCRVHSRSFGFDIALLVGAVLDLLPPRRQIGPCVQLVGLNERLLHLGQLQWTLDTQAFLQSIVK